METKPKTNADRIRAMTDEELAKVLGCPHGITVVCPLSKPCRVCMLEYLRSPVEESEK